MPSCSVMTLPKTHRIIFDTDPGVDDAMALFFALAHPAIDLVGITTTFGNVSVQQAAANALYLCAIAHHDLAVTQGVAGPLGLATPSYPAHIHGADGLGNLPDRRATANRLAAGTSAAFIVKHARENPGEISLVAVGPLGNLSLALEIEPALPRLLRQVVLMGGTVHEPGNVSTLAEANIWSDPYAAARVFRAGFKLTMVGLDVTHRVVLPLAALERIASHHRHHATDTLLHAVRFYANFYGSRHSHVAEIKGCFGHDVLALIYLVNPELFGIDRGEVVVETEGAERGQTRWSRSEDSGTKVCLSVCAEACEEVFLRTLMAPWL